VTTRVTSPPRLLVAVAIAGLALFFVLPLAGLVARASGSTLVAELGTHAVLSALLLSLVCSGAATAISVVAGVPIALLIARADFPGRSVVRSLTMLPLVLPPVVGGVALLLAFGRRGFVGELLGLHLPFTTWGAIAAETFVALPFLIITVEAGLRSVEPGFEETASALGAGPWRLLFGVSIPLIGPALLSGIALAWARALGEFGATITFAGNVPGRTQTLPLAVYVALENDPQAAIALSLVLLAISIAVLVIVGRRSLLFGGARA
jgi:molybdate transport system permease protein